MTAANVRGWCPSLHEPMAALDGLIVRVKPYVRGLSADDLDYIAVTAEQVGAGGLELTARGALQLRGLDAGGAAMFARAMVDAGLANADAAVERRRNLQLGVGCGRELRDLAAAVETWLDQDHTLAGLPSKFGFAVSPADGISADIAVLGEAAGCILIGGDVVVSSGPDPLDTVQRLTAAFLTLAPRQPVPPRRMKGLIKAMGAAAVLAQAGSNLSAPLSLWPKFTTIGAGQDGFGLGVVFGVLNPAALRSAADLARRHGDGGVLLAPGRIIWLQGVSSSAEPRLATEASAAGFVIDPHDQRLRLDACVGHAGCARATGDVRADALRLAWAAPATGLHVAGCVKGCAHPGVAGVTLVSNGAPGRYDLIRDGAPSAPATYADMRLDEIAEHLSQAAP